jgi:isoleucyl-tRNA synthetase
LKWLPFVVIDVIHIDMHVSVVWYVFYDQSFHHWPFTSKGHPETEHEDYDKYTFEHLNSISIRINEVYQGYEIHLYYKDNIGMKVWFIYLSAISLRN